MGIVKEVLADFKTSSGRHYIIELNKNDSIHIHTEHVRVDLDRKEFVEFANTVNSGHDELKNIKDEI